MWVGFLGPTLFLITLTFNVGGALEFGLLPWLVTHVQSFPALAWIILPPCTKYLVAAGGDVTALSPAALPSALRYLAMYADACDCVYGGCMAVCVVGGCLVFVLFGVCVYLCFVYGSACDLLTTLCICLKCRNLLP